MLHGNMVCNVHRKPQAYFFIRDGEKGGGGMEVEEE